ncbi:alpha/beta hydrolase [Archangium violaceum]|uniref:poly(ethylene terephthalate) hydrolase family protein n=1 Tax=Archangium violaceum TaxID=83451 RepID=UPI001952000A|nr:alpha/beta hydrolase [Archangium violaceum]QRN93189.1 alpha/beta hydrolase [Archangium violaceum]
MKNVIERASFAMSLTLAALLLSSCTAAPPVRGAIESRYAEPGPLAIGTELITNDRGEALYQTYFPEPLTTGHPVIVWGNGTDALPSNYDALLRHLASWGFVVIDTFETHTGTGAEILAAARYLVSRHETPGSRFSGKLDVRRIGAAGHSQGSTGVINSHTNFEAGSLITTVVSIALPALRWCDPEDKYDTSRLAIPFLILGGTGDGIISPAADNQRAFDRTAPGVPAAMAIASGASHNEIQGDGGMHRGYLTAWMRYWLAQDGEARAAFAGDMPELAHHPGWLHVALKNLE